MNLRLNLPATLLGAAFGLALAGSTGAHAASVKNVKTISPRTMVKTFPSERGSGAVRNATLPRGRYCRADSAGFRLWWSEVAAGQAIADDGNCRTVPEMVRVTADQLSASRRGAIRLGLAPARRDSRRPPGQSHWPPGGDNRYDVAIVGAASTLGEAGINMCRSAQARRGSRTLATATHMRLHVGPPGATMSETSLRATIAHEYFHGMQCTSLKTDKLVRSRSGLRFSSPPVELLEATAEWFANTVYPQGDAGELLPSGDQFIPGRGTALCSEPTRLLGGERDAPYTAGAILAGAFGPTKADARRVVRGLRKTSTTRLSTPFASALRKGFGASRIATGMTNAIQRACVGRTTVSGGVPLLAGTPTPIRPLTHEMQLTSANRTGVATITVDPLATAVVLVVTGRSPGPDSYALNVVGGVASLAAYTASAAGTAAGFDAAGNATLPNDTGFAAIVIANPSLSTPITSQVTATAVGG